MSDSAPGKFIIVQGVVPFGMEGIKGSIPTMFRLNTTTGKAMYLGITRLPSGMTVHQWKTINEPE